MSRIALIGASGEVGSRLLKELSDRGHTVTAIARHPEKIASLPNVTAVQGDVNDLDGLIALLQGHDVAISAVRFASSDPSKLITAVRAAGVPRYLVVGGAASLEVAPGQRLIDQPAFPDAYRTEALGGLPFWISYVRKKSWIGLSCRPRQSLVPVSARANSVWAKTVFWSPTKAARFLMRITPSLWWTRLNILPIRASALP